MRALPSMFDHSVLDSRNQRVIFLSVSRTPAVCFARGVSTNPR